jgi:uncharacterized SAM-binding protein YcdF (DUF218 family)
MEPLFALRLLARSWLLPPAGPLLLALLGLWLARRRPALGTTLAVTGIGVLLAMSIPVVSDAVQRRVEIYPSLDLSAPIEAGAVVVLAGGVRSGPSPGAPAEPSAITLERLAHGIEVARRTGLPLLLSGGVVLRGPAEAETMQVAARRYFGTEARWLETGSRTTDENAAYSAALLNEVGIRRVVLVTSSVHMRRAVSHFEAQGLEVVPAPIGGSLNRYDGLPDWLPNAATFQRTAMALHEIVGSWVTGPRAGAGAVR